MLEGVPFKRVAIKYSLGPTQFPWALGQRKKMSEYKVLTNLKVIIATCIQ